MGCTVCIDSGKDSEHLLDWQQVGNVYTGSLRLQ